MKHQKPLAVRIFIRICVVFMTISLVIWGSAIYMFSTTHEAGEDTENIDTWTVEEQAWDNSLSTEEEQIILPEIDAENPENSEAPILITEEWEIDEMDQTFEVQLENGETEVVRQWDLWDAIEINQ